MDKVGLRAQFEAAPGTVGEQGGEVETLRGELIFKGRENLYSRDPLKRRSDAHSVHRLQASLHNRGRPSAPCKADLYYRGALKRHSEAHPVAPVGNVWMPSCQMDGLLFHIPAKRRSGAASVAPLGRARTREGAPSDARGANLY